MITSPKLQLTHLFAHSQMKANCSWLARGAKAESNLFLPQAGQKDEEGLVSS